MPIFKKTKKAKKVPVRPASLGNFTMMINGSEVPMFAFDPSSIPGLTNIVQQIAAQLFEKPDPLEAFLAQKAIDDKISDLLQRWRKGIIDSVRLFGIRETPSEIGLVKDTLGFLRAEAHAMNLEVFEQFKIFEVQHKYLCINIIAIHRGDKTQYSLPSDAQSCVFVDQDIHDNIFGLGFEDLDAKVKDKMSLEQLFCAEVSKPMIVA